MKSTHLASALALLLVGAGCSNTAPTSPTGTGGSNSSGTGGTSATGGTTASGGNTGSGGTTTGTGGTSSTGGTTGTGGVTNSGGTTGTGGVTNSGGTTGGGGVTSTGGTTGTGGVGGGHTGGTTGAGGSNVGGSSGTAGTSGDLLSIVGALDGSLMTHDCAKASSTGYDCPNIGPCSGNQVTWTKMFPISGTTGQKYTMAFHVYGVVEPYNYVNTTRDAGANTSVTSSLDLFAHGGTAQPANGNGYDYNTYEVDVYPAGSGMMPDVYYLNSVDNADNPHVNTNTTQHTTFPISYAKTITIYGGGQITFKTFDSNCVQVMNCGTLAQNSNNSCSQHYTVSLTGTDPAPPSTFHQPYDGASGNGEQYGQWVFIDVTAVTAQ